MNWKRPAIVVLGGMMLALGGCAYNQFSTMLLGAAQGEVRLYGYATPAEAAVAAEASLTKANWTVKSSVQNERFTLEGTTKSGYPFKVVLTRADNGKGETWVKGQLEIAGPDLTEIRVILAGTRPNQENRPEEIPAEQKK